jgi:hypothetical protein
VVEGLDDDHDRRPSKPVFRPCVRDRARTPATWVRELGVPDALRGLSRTREVDVEAEAEADGLSAALEL